MTATRGPSGCSRRCHSMLVWNCCCSHCCIRRCLRRDDAVSAAASCPAAALALKLPLTPATDPGLDFIGLLNPDWMPSRSSNALLSNAGVPACLGVPGPPALGLLPRHNLSGSRTRRVVATPAPAVGPRPCAPPMLLLSRRRPGRHAGYPPPPDPEGTGSSPACGKQGRWRRRGGGMNA